MESISDEKQTKPVEPEILVFFINGMLTGPREASLDALELGEFLGLKVRTIYNPTHGILRDFFKNLWFFFGGRPPVCTIACKEIEEALQFNAITVVTIAHSQGAMVINGVIDLLVSAQRARMGVVTLASPIIIDPDLGMLFVEHIEAKRDLVPKLKRLWRRSQKAPEVIILESGGEKRFEHGFLGGTYQKFGWPRLKKIIEDLKQSLISKMDSNKQ